MATVPTDIATGPSRNYIQKVQNPIPVHLYILSKQKDGLLRTYNKVWVSTSADELTIKLFTISLAGHHKSEAGAVASRECFSGWNWQVTSQTSWLIIYSLLCLAAAH